MTNGADVLSIRNDKLSSVSGKVTPRAELRSHADCVVGCGVRELF